MHARRSVLNHPAPSPIESAGNQIARADVCERVLMPSNRSLTPQYRTLTHQFEITQEALVSRIRLAFCIEGIELIPEFLSERTILFETLPGINGEIP